MKPVIKIVPKNGEVFTVISSQGVYFVFDDYYQAACAVNDLHDSYLIKIDINKSLEVAARFLQAENLYRQIRYKYDCISNDVQSLPPIKTLPYGALGTPLPKGGELTDSSAVYVILCSDGKKFCLNNFSEVAQLLMNMIHINHIIIKKCENILEASRMILSRDAAIQVMAGQYPQLLPPVRAGVNYAVKGESVTFSNKFLY
ncbi:hypothetical protein [Pectinatus frisingensis]|uniref:hypothetical protein n=1 Tax=Pectinatus frisingensis TaxID=865 RepID=UPI0018C54898|nr:hypothetical protein [Pectinatus frisingensis]